jgi:restriction system protein
MAVWLVRAGSHGEFQDKFLSEKRVYVTWDDLNVNLAMLPDRDALIAALEQRYPASKPKKLINHASQIWLFAHDMQKGDWIVLPLKTQRAIQIGELTGDYTFEPAGPSPFFHWRGVKWIGEAVPRSHFGKDLLNTFGAFMTICRVQKNDAEARLKTMRKNGWQPESVAQVLAPTAPTAEADEAAALDLEERARDGIARLILSRFKGNDLTRLVDGILRAQGYTTWRSPAGADGGADILAGAGPLGFGSPRLVVEVKSEQSPIDRPTVDKLLGSVSKFGAAKDSCLVERLQEQRPEGTRRQLLPRQVVVPDGVARRAVRGLRQARPRPARRAPVETGLGGGVDRRGRRWMRPPSWPTTCRSPSRVRRSRSTSSSCGTLLRRTTPTASTNSRSSPTTCSP